MSNDKQIKQERIVGEIFIEYYNKLNQKNYILESLEERSQKRDPPDLIFYDKIDKMNKLEVEVTGGYDSADIDCERRKKDRNSSKIRLMHRIDPVEIIRFRIENKINCSIKNILVDCYSSGSKDDTRWHGELRPWCIEILKQQDCLYSHFENIWLIASSENNGPVVHIIKEANLIK